MPDQNRQTASLAVTEVSSKTFVRRVYSDALGYRDSYAAKLGHPEWSVYEVIDVISPITGSRLRSIGAHADASRWRKTEYLIEFHVTWGRDVPASWLSDWTTDLARQTRGLAFRSVTTVIIDKVTPIVTSAVRTSMSEILPYLVIAYIVLDAYGETKADIKRRVAG